MCPLLAYSRQSSPFQLLSVASCQNFFLAMKREARLEMVGGDCTGDNLYGDSEIFSILNKSGTVIW